MTRLRVEQVRPKGPENTPQQDPEVASCLHTLCKWQVLKRISKGALVPAPWGFILTGDRDG